MSAVVGEPDVLVIGAGFGGIAIAIALRQSGFSDIVVLEQARALGGVWRDNVYPNAACDVPAHLYSYSFRPNAEWSCNFAPQEEILAYVNEVASEYDVDKLVNFECTVTGAVWSENDRRWTVTSHRGDEWRPRFLVSAVGILNRPVIPHFPNLSAFHGECFHTAAWRDDVDLEGRTVAIVGSGAFEAPQN